MKKTELAKRILLKYRAEDLENRVSTLEAGGIQVPLTDVDKPQSITHACMSSTCDCLSYLKSAPQKEWINVSTVYCEGCGAMHPEGDPLIKKHESAPQPKWEEELKYIFGYGIHTIKNSEKMVTTDWSQAYDKTVDFISDLLARERKSCQHCKPSCECKCHKSAEIKK